MVDPLDGQGVSEGGVIGRCAIPAVGSGPPSLAPGDARSKPEHMALALGVNPGTMVRDVAPARAKLDAVRCAVTRSLSLRVAVMRSM